MVYKITANLTSHHFPNQPWHLLCFVLSSNIPFSEIFLSIDQMHLPDCFNRLLDCSWTFAHRLLVVVSVIIFFVSYLCSTVSLCSPTTSSSNRPYSLSLLLSFFPLVFLLSSLSPVSLYSIAIIIFMLASMRYTNTTFSGSLPTGFRFSFPNF